MSDPAGSGAIRDYGTTHKPNGDPSIDECSGSDTSSEDELSGVKAIEAVARAWTPWSLAMAYIGIALIANATSLEGQTTTNLTPIATSAFQTHSLVATVLVVQAVILSVVKPPMAKVSDVFGRLEAFSISVLLYVIGYIQQAASNNVKTYAAAQIFYSAGSTGLQILIQIFVADTTNLKWRALFSSLPDLPFLYTAWIGANVAGSITARTTWRWGYGVWAIVLPVAFLPLALSLFLNQRKAKKLGILQPSPYKGEKPMAVLKHLWHDLDFFGLLLLCAAITLILLPLTLAATARNGWKNPSIIAMIVVGILCLIAFPFWERSPKLAPKAFFPKDLFKQRTVAAGVAIAFFYFMAFYLSVQPYFLSYLLVVQNQSLTAAGHITQTFSFTSSVTSVLLGLVIYATGHYKYFITLGACIYLLGIGLMIRYRAQGASLASIIGCQVAVGIGGGLVNVPTQLGVQASASHGQVAAATAVFLTILEIGGGVGSAIAGAIWSNNVPKKLALYLPPSAQSDAAAIFASVTTASTLYAPGTPERDAINRAYQETMTTLLIVAVCVCVPLIPLSLVMKNYNLKTIDQKVEGLVIGGLTETAGASESRLLDPDAAQARRSGKARARKIFRGSGGEGTA